MLQYFSLNNYKLSSYMVITVVNLLFLAELKTLTYSLTEQTPLCGFMEKECEHILVVFSPFILLWIALSGL